MNKTLGLLVLTAVMLALAACGTTGEVKEETAAPAEGAASAPAAGGGAEATGAAAGAGPGAEALAPEAAPAPAVHPLDDPNSPLAKRVVYFDFDRSDVKEEYREILAAHARYLAEHPSASVTIEGHADERGTREYNMALGERRAKAVKRLLVAMGASADQISVISYGEERPAALGHDESAWALNRRAEIIYTSR